MPGTFENNTRTVIVYDSGDAITFDTTEVLKVGQEVRLTGDKAVGARTAGTQFCIGTIITPSYAGDTNVVVKSVFECVLQGVAAGAPLTAGAFVKQNGTSSQGLSEYVVAASGDYALGYVLIGGAAGDIIRVGVLEAAHLVA
jgi:hypothetical protein